MINAAPADYKVVLRSPSSPETIGPIPQPRKIKLEKVTQLPPAQFMSSQGMHEWDYRGIFYLPRASEKKPEWYKELAYGGQQLLDAHGRVIKELKPDDACKANYDVTNSQFRPGMHYGEIKLRKFGCVFPSQAATLRSFLSIREDWPYQIALPLHAEKWTEKSCAEQLQILETKQDGDEIRVAFKYKGKLNLVTQQNINAGYPDERVFPPQWITTRQSGGRCTYLPLVSKVGMGCRW